MNPYVSITCRTFTIWIMASIINGLLCGIYFAICDGEYAPVLLGIVSAGVCSLFFSVPGIFIFWVIMLLMIGRKLHGRALFRAALSTGMLLASATAFLFAGMVSRYQVPVISSFIILSAITSIMMHFTRFKKMRATEKFQINI